MAGLINKTGLLQQVSVVRFQCLLRGLTKFSTTFEKKEVIRIHHWIFYIFSQQVFTSRNFSKTVIFDKQICEENMYMRREEEINKERLRAKLKTGKSIKEEIQNEYLRDELKSFMSGTVLR